METTQWETVEQRQLNDGRKTIDVWILEGKFQYGNNGWEFLCCELLSREIRLRYREYKENEPYLIGLRIRLRRIKKEKYISGDF
jgi:hypothetical protein